jgi:hypothetical protein
MSCVAEEISILSVVDLVDLDCTVLVYWLYSAFCTYAYVLPDCT